MKNILKTVIIPNVWKKIHNKINNIIYYNIYIF